MHLIRSNAGHTNVSGRWRTAIPFAAGLVLARFDGQFPTSFPIISAVTNVNHSTICIHKWIGRANCKRPMSFRTWLRSPYSGSAVLLAAYYQRSSVEAQRRTSRPPRTAERAGRDTAQSTQRLTAW